MVTCQSFPIITKDEKLLTIVMGKDEFHLGFDNQPCWEDDIHQYCQSNSGGSVCPLNISEAQVGVIHIHKVHTILN